MNSATLPRIAIAGFCLLSGYGCASFSPRPIKEMAFFKRAQIKSDGAVSVTVAVLSAAESKEAFGVDLARKGIQPVWLKIDNRDQMDYRLLPVSIDKDYFSPLEASWKSHFRFSWSRNREMDDHFYSQQIDLHVPRGAVSSGFLFTNLTEGSKAVLVELLGSRQKKTFSFFLTVPGIRPDHMSVNFDAIYSTDQILSYDSEAEFRSALETLPCYATDKEGKATGDPLNLVVIGGEGQAWHEPWPAFVARGWHETETVYGGSEWKTFASFVFGGQYEYSPFSPLYVYGRPQDIGFQKTRATIRERNHLRLWLAPLRFKGKPVWVGAISRDIGVRFTLKAWPLVTHKIDADVDNAREYLVQDLLYSQHVAKIGLVRGVGVSTPSAPRRNLTGDPFFTDGLRAVFMMTSQSTSLTEVGYFLDWEEAGPR
ncbi:MAG: LssY C-terminal domain-containing protein [Opitutae bacterium]|nr:LssY C-terminal domain-containing protein [Opitutae bacterium]